jgi:hypothetical protein
MRKSFCWLIKYALLLLASVSLNSRAQEQTPTTKTNLALRQITPEIFQLGSVRLDKSKKTVQFPAQFNMKEGLLEYLLVTTKGKTHESLLKTEAEPYQIHAAMLLLGAKGAPPSAGPLNAPSAPHHVNRNASQTNGAAKKAIAGDSISIELIWKEARGEKRVRAEDCVYNLETKTTASRGVWSYNGSRVVEGTFIAQREGSLVALVEDSDALANNPRSGHDNDQIWQINTNALPSLNTPVQVTFKLEK